ncbi:M23 family metallopeptidase [Subdoligranulum variabile]|uniref:Peptidase, M23 family n=1 Tax=Subdoligranulum variabile DSM 15176 TaxID=411471 RepID=D1PLU5_9FIRM|nr:M23 family metallopeptidase [Subdoligranulum variabile]EFB76393.1 peptidase, M23 family [Subdoligranulum variabile DSM 15176]UWP67867.1 peptidoglycan DD-metalloendopeptidase family protein [Subdoligranulum variabile]
MQEEKNRTTPGQKTDKKRRRRKKNSAAGAHPAVKATPEQEKKEPENVLEETAEQPPEPAASQPDVVTEEAKPAGEEIEPAAEDTPAQDAVAAEPESPELAEPAQPVETVQEAEDTPAQKAEESADEEAAAEPEAAVPEGETEGPQSLEPSQTEQTSAKEESAPENPGPTPPAEVETTESPEKSEEPAIPEPSEKTAPTPETDEKTEEKTAEETPEEPALAETEEDSSAKEELPEEDEQRLSDLTRTVQLSVEQIMSRVSEEEAAEEAAEIQPEADDEEEEAAVTLQDHLRTGLSGMAKWFLLVVFFVLVIAGCGVAWLYRSATPDMLPQITVTFAGQTLEPTAYKWKVPVIGNLFKRTYADTYSSTPVDLSETIDQVSPDFVISPSDYRTELTVTDAEENVIFEGDTDTFSSFQFTSNGTYTAKLVVHSDASSVPGDTSVTGSETWYFHFTVGVRPSVRLSSTAANQGSAVAVRVGDTLDGSQPTLQTELENAGFFKASSGWVCYLPVPWDEPAGTQTIVVTAGGYTETLELKVKAVSWEYKDYYNNSQRISPYIGQYDIPAELQKLLTQSDTAIAWSNGGFVQPFLNTLDVKLAFGTTEYVGRNYSQRNSNNGSGGRTLTNLVLDTTSGELLIAPASGKVLLAKDLGGDFGYTLVIDHGAGVKSIFYNLQKISVKSGEELKQGQTLATCNKTTVAEVRIGTVPVDPLQVWRGQCDALKYY